jgi:CHASE3 domain sensor protein
VLKTTEAQDRILDSLDKAIADARLFTVDETVRQRLHAAIPRDLEELEQPLQRRLDEGREAAQSALRERGEAEAKAFVDLLLDQRRRIVREATEFDRDVRQLVNRHGIRTPFSG